MEEFNHIKRVPVPDFMYAKIQAEIKRRKENVTPPQLIMASLLLIVMLAINGLALKSSNAQSSNSDTVEALSTSLNLNPTNQLYNE